MMNLKDENGFSLVELMMAAFLTVGVLGGIFAMMNRNQGVYIAESGSTDMNQNLRTATDFLTRDIQSAGVGLPRPNGSYSAIFHIDGASNSPDQLLLVNGDPFAPFNDGVKVNSSTYQVTLAPEVNKPNTTSPAYAYFTYRDLHTNQMRPVYRSFANDQRKYIIYDDNKAMVFSLTADATLSGNQINLPHTAASDLNPPTAFGTTSDTGEPDYANAMVAVLDSLVAYRLDTTTGELLRTANLTNWYPIARGIKDIQIKYRIITPGAGGVPVETIETAPAVRRNIRSVIITIRAETPDLQSSDKGYREAVTEFEVAPRNLNLLRNNNLSANTKGTWLTGN